MAVCKVNIDTDLRLALTAKIRQVFAEKPGEFDPRKYLGPGRDAITAMVKHKLHVLGCAGKAAECA
jgi:fructose-bisphosphate aldolase class II